MTIDPRASDDFFNDADVMKAYREATENGVSPVLPLLDAAKRLIVMGGLDASYSPEDYAADFLSRV